MGFQQFYVYITIFQLATLVNKKIHHSSHSLYSFSITALKTIKNNNKKSNKKKFHKNAENTQMNILFPLNS
jgi:predicted ABC-type exoprotein transport system permease subunit